MPAETTILAFACQCCAYTAADVAGALRLEYPAAVRIVRLPCAGRVDTAQIMGALEAGADAVMVAGCPEGDCHFVDGNTRAAARVRSVQQLLAEVGLEPERLSMVHVASRDGAGFARIVGEATAQAEALGPSPLRPDEANAGAEALGPSPLRPDPSMGEAR